MSVIVIKVGGGEGIDLDGVAAGIAALQGAGRRLLLVHGGSHLTNELAAALGHEAQFIRSPSGYESRYSDRRTMEIFKMVYCGRVNKELVERLQARGVNAVGLSGLDGGLWQGPRKESIRQLLPDGRQRLVRDSLTGRVERVNVGLLSLLLEAGYLPVLTPPALSDDGQAINVDGDRAAAATAVAMGAGDLLILSNVRGVLADFPHEESLISCIHEEELPRIRREAAQGRMRIKLLAAEEALAGGVARVVIGDARGARAVERAWAGEGTVIRRGREA